jgi:hypothetical protein
MAEKLTLKSLQKELEGVRAKVTGLEKDLQKRLDSAVTPTLKKLKQMAGSAAARSGVPIPVSDARRRRMVEGLAYLHAQQRGFAAGWADDDWYRAEAEVDLIVKMLAEGET